jgi:hypothetical protein
VGYRLPLVEPLELRAHLLVGALFASAVDTVTASADGGVPASVQGSGQSASAPNLVVLPELQLGLRFGGFGAGAGLTVAIVTLDGPSSKLGQTQVDPAGCPMNPVACAAGTRAIEGEAAYGPFVAFIPSVSAGYAFSL